MMYPDARAVRGFLADADTGSGLGGLTIELWSANGHGPELIAEGRSDESGFFRCAVPQERFANRDFVDIELRVLDAGRPILSDVQALPASGRAETIELSVPRSPAGASSLSSDFADLDSPPEPDPAARGTVAGRIRGAVPEGARVRAVVRTLRDGSIDEQVAAEAIVDDDGRYQLSYDRPGTDDRSDNSLHIQLYGADGEALIAESAPLLGPPAQARVYVRTRPGGPGLSEYALIEQQLGEGLRSGVSGLEGVDESGSKKCRTDRRRSRSSQHVPRRACARQGRGTAAADLLCPAPRRRAGEPSD